MLLLLAACNFRFVPTSTPSATATPPPLLRLTVTYLQDSTLYFWREGENSPRAIAMNAGSPLALAPDGQRVAFARGQNGQPQTLWVVSPDQNLEQNPVELGDIPAQRSATAIIRELAWLDPATLYFNTVQAYDWGFQPDNNLYRVNISTETQPASGLQLILPPGAGGAFAFSPDQQHIAVAYPGQYDTERGRISILDPLGETVRTALEFRAVSTASEVPFYPPLSWTPDSAAVRVPIPDRDLVYDEVLAPPVELWHLPVEGDSRIMGYAPSTFNGLPRWSSLTNTMLYHQRSAALDMFDLFIADMDGGNAERYADGGIEILSAQWIAGEGRFVFARGTTLMLGERGAASQPIATSVQNWVLAGDTVIYTTLAGELRYVNVDTPATSTLIATNVTTLLFDAVFAP